MIGIICAMQIEADGILAICENTHQEEKCGMTFTRGTLNGVGDALFSFITGFISSQPKFDESVSSIF